jgi:hypothetical protein
MIKVQGYDEIGRVFTNYFTEAQNNIFKLGVLQDYVDEDASPSWHAWKAGRRQESMQLVSDDARYKDWIQKRKESHAAFTRVQVIEQPLSSSSYAAWQLALFAEFQRQGIEEAYSLEATRLLGRAALPESDIVIFDNQRVLQWSYAPDSQGQVDGGTIWDVAAGDDIEQFLALQKDVLDQARPVAMDY